MDMQLTVVNSREHPYMLLKKNKVWINVVHNKIMCEDY